MSTNTPANGSLHGHRLSSGLTATELNQVKIIAAKLAPWQGDLCPPHGPAKDWPVPAGGCGFCERRVLEGQPVGALLSMPFIVCVDCGDKRCPKASWHGNECAQSRSSQQQTHSLQLPTVEDTKFLLELVLRASESGRSGFSSVQPAQVGKRSRQWARRHRSARLGVMGARLGAEYASSLASGDAIGAGGHVWPCPRFYSAASESSVCSCGRQSILEKELDSNE